MENEFVVGLMLAIILSVAVAVLVQAISFIFDVPKQLKRIADALEKGGTEDGK